MKSLVLLFTVNFIFIIPSIAQTEWTKYENNPVLDYGPAGSWDEIAVELASVLFDGNIYHMWYSGYDGLNFRIGYATSSDGIDWTKDTVHNPILDVGPPGSWDNFYVYFPCVVLVDDTFHMWYAGNDEFQERTGHATSLDGFTWVKDTLNNPVLDVGTPGSWDDGEVFPGCKSVLFDGSMYRMWYGGVGFTSHYSMGLATSTDGIKWDKHPDPVMEAGEPGTWDWFGVIPNTIIFDGTSYQSWYSGYDFLDTKWRVGYATSTDGIQWVKDTINNPVLSEGPPGSWDHETAFAGSVLFDNLNFSYKMWYSGGGTSTGRIGFALAPQDTLHVPGDYTSIQEAIDAAVSGNVVLVAEDTYYENINFRGKAITVASHFFVDGDTSHISNTVIDGSQPSHPDSGSVVYFTSGEDTTSVLCGFTITGGTGTYTAQFDDVSGGGIFLYPSGGKICNNIIENNVASYNINSYGGGIMGDLDSSNIIIENNIIRNNTTTGNTEAGGGGIALFNWTFGRILNNTIVDNSATSSTFASGGGITCNASFDKICIIGNYIKGNECNGPGWGGGGLDLYNCTTVVKNNLIVENSALNGGGVYLDLVVSTSTKKGLNIGRLLNQNDGDKSSLYNSSQIQSVSSLENNTVVNNLATVSGGGIYVTVSSLQFMNFIIWGNTAPNLSQIAGNPDVQYSDVEGGWSGTGNTNEDPKFDDSTYFVLNYYSTCIDAGNPDQAYDDVEDPLNLGYPLLPARGSLINDMGHFGGPSSLWSNWNIPVSVENDGTENEIPNEFTLSQNYPNPFNPSTTIKYGITEQTFVELRIYDILGREVELLVNEEQDVGYYSKNFNAARLSSGVYFYQLKAGSFVETKKMILLK